ncbi:hypothetical protein [Borrelia turicatae]|nr:hypothetical protein [Borrelia turicatae]
MIETKLKMSLDVVLVAVNILKFKCCKKYKLVEEYIKDVLFFEI